MTVRKLLISVVLVAATGLAYLFLATPRPRIFYQRVGISESRRLQSYHNNRRGGAAWTRDPVEVALLLVEGCNHQTNAGFDCDNRTRVAKVPRDTQRVSVVILDDPVRGDDSIAAEEWRLDLIKGADGAWELEWSGKRWRCQRETINVWTRFFTCS